MARQLRKSMRESDIVARLGGDEFTAIALGADENGIVPIEAKIRASLSNRAAEQNLPFDVSCTIGFAAFDPRHPVDLEELLGRADRDLYEKRRIARGR